MIQKPIEDINADDIAMLISNKVPESKTIEYKAGISLKKDEEKKEFLYDISSFANASGGDILFGVAEGEEKGIPQSMEGIEENMDELKLKIENMLRDSIVPRIVNLKIKGIPVQNGKNIMIIRVPRSFNSPHQVTYQRVDRFYSRSNSGKYILDVHELRNAFLLSESLVQRMKAFINDRLARIVAGETFVDIPETAKIILHFLPVSAFDNQHINLSVDDIKNKSPFPLGGGSSDRRVNLEGVLNFTQLPGKSICDAYLQVYRTGILETVNANILGPSNGKKQIYTDGDYSFEYIILRSIASCLKFLEQVNVPTPMYCFLNLIGVKGYFMHSAHLIPGRTGVRMIDRDHLSLPEIALLSYDKSFIEQVHEWFNLIWNASGYDGSVSYSRNTNITVLIDRISKNLAF